MFVARLPRGSFRQLPSFGLFTGWKSPTHHVIAARQSNGWRQMQNDILSRCEAAGLRMTEQRRTIAAILQAATDHPDVEELYRRAAKEDAGISLATVYRTVKLLEETGILEKHEFGDGRARYETTDREHHDHLIDMQSGEVIEFLDPDIEALQEKIAAKLGYRLMGHRLELYGVRIKADTA